MNSDGSQLQAVLNTACGTGTWLAGRGLAWLPDGQKLPSSQATVLATINLDGSGKTIPIASGGVLGTPTFRALNGARL